MQELTVADAPVAKGVYVAYVNDGPTGFPLPVAWRKILVWDGTRWFYPFSDQRYRDHVYGCIGPLPVMRLED